MERILGKEITIRGTVIDVPDLPTFMLHTFNLEVKSTGEDEEYNEDFTILVIVKQTGFKVRELLGKKVEVRGILKLFLEGDEEVIIEAQEITLPLR